MSGERLGVAGLGRMGRAIAARLTAQGFAVVGWSRSGGAGAAVPVASDLAALAADSDMILLSLFDDAAVREVVGALSGLDLSGKLVVDTSTVDPATLNALRPALAAAGAGAVDAPISGGPETVLAGAAGMYLGGAGADVARFLPVARILAARCPVVGGPGAGAAAKIVNNVMLLGTWQTLKEALAIGRASGLGYEAMLAMIEASPGANPALIGRLPVLRGESDAVGFSVDGVVKDAAVFAAVARRLGVDVPAVEAARASFAAHAAAGHGDEDLVTMVRAAVLGEG